MGFSKTTYSFLATERDGFIAVQRYLLAFPAIGETAQYRHNLPCRSYSRYIGFDKRPEHTGKGILLSTLIRLEEWYLVREHPRHIISRIYRKKG